MSAQPPWLQKLVDLADGSCKGTAAVLNPQTRWGDDVISRIAHAQTEEGLEELHEAIIESVGSLISELCEKSQYHTVGYLRSGGGW